MVLGFELEFKKVVPFFEISVHCDLANPFILSFDLITNHTNVCPHKLAGRGQDLPNFMGEDGGKMTRNFGVRWPQMQTTTRRKFDLDHF